MTIRSMTLLSPILVATALAVACAINPATGKRELMLVTESQERQLGLQYDQTIVQQMGLYPDEELQAYVQRLGLELASASERPNLDWTFRIVDDPVVNAFALPGGYIYITRGILAHFNSEAELVSVLGHEIGHVTARHSASQMSKQQVTQGFLLGATIAAPEKMQQLGGILETGLGLAFLHYGRDDEREADTLGLRYLLAGGYDPRPMADVFETLGRVSAAAGADRIPGWFATHPEPENRRAKILASVATLEQTENISGRLVERDGYLSRLDGLMFGENPREGYFKDSLFVHPEMELELRFPDGWKTQNTREAVAAVSPEQDALVAMRLSGAESPAAALGAFFDQEGISRTGPVMGPISGLPTAGDGFAVQTQQGVLRGRVGYVAFGGRVFELIGYTPEARWTTNERPIRSTLASFGRLRDARVKQARPDRIETVRVSRSMSVEEFARSRSATVSAETLAVLNGLDPGERLEAGRTYKIITGGLRP